MTEITSQKARVQAYALVRDKDGKPKFDDPHNIPAPLWAMLTDSEKEELRHGRNT